MFWSVGLIGACYGIAMALVLSGIQLYVRYSLGLPVVNALYLQGIVILVTAGGLVLWTRLVARRGALWAWRIAFAVLAAGFAALFFATGLVTAIAAGMLVGAGWSGMLATNDLIVARVLDADAARNGEHREGLFLSAFGFFGRLNGIVTGLALTSLGVFLGYNSGDDPGADPGLAFRVYLCVYPFVLTTIGAVAARLVSVPIETPPEATDPAPPAGPGPADDSGAADGPGLSDGSGLADGPVAGSGEEPVDGPAVERPR